MNDLSVILGLFMVGISIVGSIVGIGLWLGRVSIKADEASQRSHRLANELASFKYEVATQYAQKSTLSEMEEKIMAAIERLADRLDRLFEAKTKA